MFELLPKTEGVNIPSYLDGMMLATDYGFTLFGYVQGLQSLLLLT